MNITDAINIEMIQYYQGDPQRIQHFTKVAAYCSLIARMHGLSQKEITFITIAGLIHDIGIKEGEKRFSRSDGKIQEELGPALAKELLSHHRTDLTEEEIQRLCYLVGHHHTYTNIDGIDYQILVEADFLVNLYERSLETGVPLQKKTITATEEKIFQTAEGKLILRSMYGIA